MWHKNYSVLRKVAHQPRHTNVQVLLTGKYPRQVFGLATSETLKKGRPGLWVSSMKLTKPHMVQVGGERLAKKLRMFETWKLQVFHHLPTKTYSTHHMCSIVGRDQTRVCVCVCIRLCNLYIHIFIYIYIWQATYTRIDAMEYHSKSAGPPPPPEALRGGPGSGGRSPVRKGYGSRPTSQTRKQAAVPPEAPVPGMQQGKRFRCTCQCITPNAPPQAPRRPNGQRTWSSLRCRPLLTGWSAIDINTGREYTEQRGDACAHLWWQVEDLIWGADKGSERKAGAKLERGLKSLRVAAGRSHICKGSTCNNDQMQHGHCSRYMEALRLGREEKMTRRGTRQWRRRRRAWPEVTTGRIKPSGKKSGGLQQRRRFCLFMCQYIYIYIYIYIVAIPVHECLYWGFYAIYIYIYI